MLLCTSDTQSSQDILAETAVIGRQPGVWPGVSSSEERFLALNLPGRLCTFPLQQAWDVKGSHPHHKGPCLEKAAPRVAITFGPTLKKFPHFAGGLCWWKEKSSQPRLLHADCIPGKPFCCSATALITRTFSAANSATENKIHKPHSSLQGSLLLNDRA